MTDVDLNVPKAVFATSRLPALIALAQEPSSESRRALHGEEMKHDEQ